MRKRGGDSSVQQKVPQPKTYVVDDASESDAQEPQTNTQPQDDMDERLRKFEAPPAGRPPGLPPAVETKPQQRTKALESLIFTGKVEREIELAGHKYKLSTLSHKEHNEIVKSIYHAGESSDIFAIRLLTLAYSLKSIDGLNLEDIDFPGTFESAVEKKKEIIDNLQLSIVEKLYETYSSLVEESDSLLNEEEIKKS